MERDGEVHGQGLGGQAPDARHNADRREREMAGREAHVAMQPRDGAPDPVVVGQRLPHPHEDDVGDPPCRPGLPHGDGNLLDDLALGQVDAGTRPGRWRRTGRPWRNRPGWIRRRSPGPGSASGRSRPGPRRGAPRATWSSRRRRPIAGTPRAGPGAAPRPGCCAGRPGARSCPRDAAPAGGGRPRPGAPGRPARPGGCRPTPPASGRRARASLQATGRSDARRLAPPTPAASSCSRSPE